jgi:predicted RNase H-like nuclease
MSVKIIGIDCAVDENNIGVAVGDYTDGGCTITKLPVRKQGETIAQMVSDFIQQSERTLLALDAPLGWPSSMGKALIDHAAGSVIQVKPDTLFRRATDRFVKNHFGKQPLDVGADRIARTALAALDLLVHIRELKKSEIPLAWEPNLTEGVAVIEVYPAGSLTVYGFPATGYKKKNQKGVRQEILSCLRGCIQLHPDLDVGIAEKDANTLDAIICVLAGTDFLAGKAKAPSPEMLEDARKEGWIWIGGKV